MFIPAPLDTDNYDEFGFLGDVAKDEGVDPASVLPCERIDVKLDSGAVSSVIKWGTTAPEFTFLHGGGQNAHTWDTLLVLMGVPAVCIDMPGHGRSDRREDRDYGPWHNALVAAETVEKLGVLSSTLVGMSLGGATAIRLAGQRPDLFHHNVIIDATPSVTSLGRPMTPEQRGSVALIGGPPVYESFEAMADATIALSPFRTPEAVRRGVRHNSVRLEDGTWRWRYDLFPRETDAPEPERNWLDFEALWEDVARISQPTMLVQGGESVYVLPEDIEKFKATLPSVRHEVVAGAGHAVQSDQPAALKVLIDDFVGGSSK
jgi:pimeloyl-ACP methyl ester carboxylesterase